VKQIVRLYRLLIQAANSLQSLLLLAVRLYWSLRRYAAGSRGGRPLIA